MANRLRCGGRNYGCLYQMNQDKHFKELKDILKEKENAQEKTNIPVDGDGTHEAS